MSLRWAMNFRWAFVICTAVACCLGSQAMAAPVNWLIDSNQSWIRLSVPDQVINIGGGNVLPVGLRDQTATPGDPAAPNWTDAGKRLAAVSGVLSTTMTPNSIEFNYGAHAAPATASGNFRPDAGSWNGTSFDTSLGATSPSVFAADLTVQGVLTVAYLNFYNVNTEYAGIATGLVDYAGVAAGALKIGADAGTILDLDALQLIGDSRTVLATLMGNVTMGTNGSLSITDLGGMDRRLDLTYDVPFVVLINGLPVNASFESVVVAYATVPEPASAGLVGLAFAMIGMRRRRAI